MDWDKSIEEWTLEQERVKKDQALLSIHIKNSLTTNSGLVLRDWLKQACCMDITMPPENIDSVAANARLNALRDLYIQLDNLLAQGINNVTDY